MQKRVLNAIKPLEARMSKEVLKNLEESRRMVEVPAKMLKNHTSLIKIKNVITV